MTKVAEAVIDNLLDKGGFDGWWFSIELDTQKKIISDVAKVIKRELDKKDKNKNKKQPDY